VQKCPRHFGTSAEVSRGHFGTGAEMSNGHSGTSVKMSRVRSVLGPKCPYTHAHFVVHSFWHVSTMHTLSML